MKEERKHVPKVQTAPDASFGPVFVICTFPNPSRRVLHRSQPVYAIKC